MKPSSDFLDKVGGESAESASGEKWGWGLLRPPPAPAFVFGAIYGLIAGMIVVYDIVVLIRMAKVLIPKIKERTPIIGSKD